MTTLELDARQRAMLQEMGITIWQPAPPKPAASAASAVSAAHQRDTAVLERDAVPAARQSPGWAPGVAPQSAEPRQRVQPPQQHPASAPPSAPVPSTTGTDNALAPVLRAPQALYPNASDTPPELGSGWLVIFETATPDEPLGGDSGRLLDNMLRAMRLHLHPRTYACVLERSAFGNHDTHTDAVKAALADALAELRPAMVLILGLGAARATLGNREPLGRLRASQHTLAGGTPAIVSYDPAYLLRAPDAKASAWADLCHALALVRKATPA